MATVGPGRDKVPKTFLLDCETTYAGEYSEDRIIELAVLPYIPRQSMDSMQPLRTVVNPLGVYTDKIPAQELQSADYFPAAWSKVSHAINAWTDPETEVPLIVAHNAPFVAKYLRAEFDRRGMPHPENLLFCCSLAIAEKIWPGKSKTLAYLAIAANVPKESVHTSVLPHQRVKLLAAVLDYMHSYTLGNINASILYSCSEQLANLQLHFPISDSVLYTVGMVHASGDALITAFSALEVRHQARSSLVAHLHDSKMRVCRIYAAIDRYARDMNKKEIPAHILRSLGNKFLHTLYSGEIGKKTIPALLIRQLGEEFLCKLWELRPALSCGEDWEYVCPTSDEKLRVLEHELISLGFVTKPLRAQLEEVTTSVRRKVHYDREISRILEAIDLTLKINFNTDVGPGEAKNLLDSLSNLRLPQIKKAELSKLTQTVWEGWRINFDDIQFQISSSGDRERIGDGATSNVFLAHMKQRDESGNIIPESPIEVAVKQYLLNSSQEKEFEYDVFLLKNIQHPCIVRTFGGYWPELAEHDVIESFVVMERMTHNLREAQDNQLLESFELKLRVLIDIAAGLEHLHDRKIVHHDIKAENVLMRVVDGKLVGRAKISGFCDSRPASQTNPMTASDETPSGLAVVSAYNPPESFGRSASQSSGTARNIWSFGVLMCEVLVPKFFKKIAQEQPERLHVLARFGALPQVIAGVAKKCAIGQDLVDLAVSCLSVEVKSRPPIAKVSEQLKESLSIPLNTELLPPVKAGSSKEGKGGPSNHPYFSKDFGWDKRVEAVVLFVRSCDDVDLVPEQAKQLLNALSRSGLPGSRKHELAKMALNVWEGWKVNVEDVEFVRKPSGDRKRIGKGGAAEVYLARLKVRDQDDYIIDGEHMEVAVKQFTVHCSKAEIQFPLFMREVFLQKHAQHPCIVQTHGGYWPDAEEIEDEDELEAWIVMERMTHNLSHALYKKLLTSFESKCRILRDVAAGIAHLHSCGIVHRDIKPENVLMRVIDGEIVGRAKVCDFGVSRKAEEAVLTTGPMQSYTKPTGTSLYMPPEAFNRSAQDANSRARDIWSFGVLMCEVIVPDFLANIGRDHPEGVDIMTRNGQFAKEVAERVQNITCDGHLGDLAISCLSLDPTLRPRIENISDKLANECT